MSLYLNSIDYQLQCQLLFYAFGGQEVSYFSAKLLGSAEMCHQNGTMLINGLQISCKSCVSLGHWCQQGLCVKTIYLKGQSDCNAIDILLMLGKRSGSAARIPDQLINCCILYQSHQLQLAFFFSKCVFSFSQREPVRKTVLVKPVGKVWLIVQAIMGTLTQNYHVFMLGTSKL